MECRGKRPLGGAYNHITRKGGIGFAFRNEFGVMAAGGACPLDGLLSAEHAEVLACRHAVDFAVKHGFTQVILEIDAQEVRRKLISSSSFNTSVLGPIYDD
ncbi:hypothetical protein ACLB2K_005101 [Fragaria x ananassa]